LFREWFFFEHFVARSLTAKISDTIAFGLRG
jgi:hypothetical protein